MKKLMTILGAFFFASVVLTSCGGGVEADAEKTCEMMCEGMDLMTKAMADPTNADLLTEATEYAEEAEKFGKEMEEKYEDDEEAQKEISAILAKCDCK
jgi:carbamate kinase